ncbi:MgtC/SapB family protein [Candidatus Pacearchaeota archaeon]|nr:MgtC/SapB family protein [Candidatus Pacearchaeota archaeon]
MILEFFFRLLLVFNLALIFGLERQRAHKQVGFGTFTFVSMGSCILSILSISVFPENPIPLLTAIVTSIGFLGAGALIKDHDKIFGFTTAASIWIFAIFGLVIGVGSYFFGLTLYCTIWVVIFIDRRLEKKGTGSYRTKLTIETNKIVGEADIRNFLLSMGIKNTKMIKFEVYNKKSINITYLIEGKSSDLKRIPKEIEKINWIDNLKFE